MIIIPPSIGYAYGLAVNALRAVSISELGIADASLGALSHENQGLIMWKLGSDIDAVRYKIGTRNGVLNMRNRGAPAGMNPEINDFDSQIVEIINSRLSTGGLLNNADVFALYASACAIMAHGGTILENETFST
ncbi:hypothetical protein BofuT4_P070870.1 [Botrytis cinerea T4]|uniref:Uncharacterized protein n=1 Tax=Botryotinia fuckeliana (strain T4) TaxID=999810 RepID=G2XQC3_BOTF4|nr:hypothetical protein BofuT4_P070870.1 [Botrytis cinerea T4]